MLKSLMLIGFRHFIPSEPLCPVERVGHRRYARRLYGLKLIDKFDDIREFRLDIGDLFSRNLEAGQ